MRTRVKCRIYYLFGLPDLWSHGLALALLVGRDELFGIFEAGRGNEECSVENMGISIALCAEW